MGRSLVRKFIIPRGSFSEQILFRTVFSPIVLFFFFPETSIDLHVGEMTFWNKKYDVGTSTYTHFVTETVSFIRLSVTKFPQTKEI